MNKNITIGLLVIVIIAIGGYGLFSNNDVVVGAPSGAAHYQMESFLQGVSAGARDQFSVSNVGALTTSGTMALSGAVAISADLNYEESTEAVTAANTLTVAESGKVSYLSGGAATSTLPAVASSDGAVFRFVVGAAVSADIHIASAEGDNIEGSLMVAGAIVDCDAIDRIDIIADGENLGDYVELRSNGTKWFITASNALSSSKMTCSEGI